MSKLVRVAQRFAAAADGARLLIAGLDTIPLTEHVADVAQTTGSAARPPRGRMWTGWLAQRLDVVLETGGALERLWPQVERGRATRDAPSDVPVSGGGSVPDDLGLGWSATPHATVEVVAELWRTDWDRRSVLASAAWVASAFAGPTHEWLLNRQDEILHDRSGRAVGQHDVDALWAMCDAFGRADYRLGGGYARSTLLHYVNQVVLPLLQGSYRDSIGRELMAATARLCDLCAFMSFDSGRQGLAQRYYIQGLRLAQASGNRALGAHILADMSIQAHHLGDATQARDLASAARTELVPSGSIKASAHPDRQASNGAP